ncbi:hypothetical protein H4R34_005049 [Dimargaris verticillata]|uniref:DUF676 domain-containing protein n=1 Tax=Dimargaris verticillata TaxID=2761393 RepID=A0A9W8EAL2_9FUNG|nr:hypothetical protein H4R34_005049 [Dimargaris verticillata]
MASLNRDKRLLLVFIHGFRGDDVTFKDFPERLRTVLTNTVPRLDVEALVFPKYETQGELSAAVQRFCLWLQDHIKQSQQVHSNQQAQTLILLVGHSMGGLLAADAILHWQSKQSSMIDGIGGSNHVLRVENTTAAVVGLVAFDSPFYGVNSTLWTDTAVERATEITSQVHSYMPALTTVGTAAASWFASSNSSATTTSAARQATTSTASRWGAAKWGALAIGGLAASAAAAATYAHRDKIQTGVQYITSHLEFVGALVRKDELETRVRQLTALPTVGFHCFYVQLERQSLQRRTFVALPPPNAERYFSPIHSAAKDEVQGHITIFDPAVNHHYYALGDETLEKIASMLQFHADGLTTLPD